MRHRRRPREPGDQTNADGKELLVALFALGAVLLSWPFLAIFSSPRVVFGIPLLVLYLFTVWAAIIVIVFCLVRRLPGG